MNEPKTGDERVESAAAPAFALIATGVMTRTREQARHEMKEREAHARATPARRHPAVDGAESSADVDEAFLLSPRYAPEATVRFLQQRPAVNFVVQNATAVGKEDETSRGEKATAKPTPPATRATPPAHSKRQSWFSPVHVPLTHRKLVESPRIFDGVTPSKPLAAKLTSGSQNQTSQPAQSTPRSLVPRVALLQSDKANNHKRRPTVDRQFIDALRAQNRELYDRIVARFKAIRRAEQVSNASRFSFVTESKQPEVVDADDMVSGITTVEDAVLFFLHEKHKHDILYFKRRSDAHGNAQAQVGGKLSLSVSFGATAKLDATARYMPYDLERVPASPEPGSGDFFIMSSTALVHHANDNSDEFIGESIPIAQWIMDSKMFSLLLAGIPLFQKFLVRKVFVWWSLETRHMIFKDMKKRLSRSLPLGRKSFARPMLASFQALRRVQQVRALTLPTKHLASISLAALHDHHRERLSEAETKFIDAKEELLQILDTMVHDIQLSTDPSTQLDDLYGVESREIHMVNPKWKSAPIKALRRRNESLTRQIETAKLDMSLLNTYVRLMEYMFTESVYLMILGCVRYLTCELRVEENQGTMSAAVAIVKDDLVLSPSVVEMKNVILEGIARLIRLAGNFHFTKNAVTWSTNRGSGSLALIASAFASEAISSQFDLQEVLRKDIEFKEVSSKLIEEVASCFDEAAQQMKAFESLKPIYAAVQSVSRAGSIRNLKGSTSNLNADVVADLPSVLGVSGSELARYLRSLTHRLSVLDRSQHACQKIQSSWKVGFLEIQCRRSVTEILDLINEEREMLHQHVFQLAAQGANECLTAIQKASTVFEDRPQLIEYFCEQLKQAKMLKDHDKQLHQDIRNVDEVVRALRRYAPTLLTESSVQYNLLHTMYTKYGMLTQSHDKFVSKMLPNITQQVSNALQRYTVRCQRLIRIYEENSAIATEEELEKNVGAFQDISREIRTIENATRLYQDYQRMVGMKVMEITMLADARLRWDEVQDLVTFTIQWKAATKIMESGIFNDQPWRNHHEKAGVFLARIQAMQQDRTKTFASGLIERLKVSIADYQRRVELLIDMAEPFVKSHHWQQILMLLDIVNYVSVSGVVLSDGSSLTLGFLQTHSLWKFEGHIREITLKARHDAVTESKIEDMKRRLNATMLPLVKVDESYELEAAGTLHILTQFEDDLVTVQTLAQFASSAQLSSSLAQWAEEISNYQDILDSWVGVQADWNRLALIFGNHDVQQIVVDATYEFQALERKWQAMMTAVKGTSLLTVCLREVMSRSFLNTCSVTFEKLWKELGSYLWEKRHFFPRLHFVSDRDLLHIIASSKYPARLCRLISKCFREIHFLRIVRVDTANRQKRANSISKTSTLIDPDDNDNEESCLDQDKVVRLFDIEGVVGRSSNEELHIKALRVTSSPEIWMKDLSNRITDAVKESVCVAMDGPLASAYEGHFEDLYRSQSAVAESEAGDKTPLRIAPRYSSLSKSWMALPLHLIILCLNVMLTNELTALVFLERNGGDWASFWDGFIAKKRNLTGFIRRRDITKRERLVASNILLVLLNKTDGIEDLFHEEVATIPSSSVALSAHNHHDTTAIHYNYANGSSFAWTKMMRFYYEPFDKKCVIHQSVKTYEFGNSFLGGYVSPVLTPLCDRVVLALNLAVSMEVGAIIHSSASAQSVGKQTLLKELATSIGNELVPFDCSMAVGFSQFHQLLLGALQCESCWVFLHGLECRTQLSTIRFVSREIGRLRDVIHGGQDVFTLDGMSVTLSNSNVGIFVSASLDLHNNADHRELMLRMSHMFMPVVCHPPETRRIGEAILAAAGMTEAAELSGKLVSLCELLKHSPARCLSAPVSLRQFIVVFKSTAAKHVSNVWKSEEKCLILSLWEEIGINVIPDQRVFAVKVVRSILPGAEKLQLSPLGMLATRTMAENSDKKQPNSGQSDVDDELAYDSDEDEKRQDLLRFQDEARSAMEALKQLVPTDQYIRKLIDFYQVSRTNMFTVLVGQSGCGKTTALEILHYVTTHHRNATPRASETSSQATSADPPDNHSKTVRLFPSAYEFKDIYGQFDDDATWQDGFLTKFMKSHCEDATHVRVAPATTDSGGSARFSHRLQPPWLVLDGLADPSVLEPLKEFATGEASGSNTLQLPNGDQLHCENAMMRIFCEVSDLEEWSPATITRCGVLYFPSDLVPYTVLIKSWARRYAVTKPKHAPMANRMAKMARSMLPPLLDVCKRNVKAVIETLVSHLVHNFLHLLGWFVEQMPVDLASSDEVIDEVDDKIVIIYAAMMTLGLCVPEKGQVEFHTAAVALVPEIVKLFGPDLFTTGGRTLYDVSLKFENENLQLGIFEAPLPLLADGYMSWHRNGMRRKSTFRRMSSSNHTRGGGLVGLGTSPTLFIPTPRLLAYRDWMKTMLLAKANVIAVGASAIGKTRLLEDTLTELIQSERFDNKCFQINGSARGEDILSCVESGLPRKMRSVYCPGAGKRALVVAIENLNLETERHLPTGLVVRPCTEMIRQICDARGGFVKTTKEFVEFRDVALACSFTTTTNGQRLSARLLRHFHVMWMTDPSRDVFRTILATFPEQVVGRLPQTAAFTASNVARLCRFPIEIFYALRKRLKPTRTAPHLLLSMNDVLRCFSRLMNVSAKSTESFSDLEIYAVSTTYQLYRSRMMDQTELSKLQSLCISVAKKIGCSSTSWDVIKNPSDYLFADYGDNDGCVRISNRAAVTLFIAADERFQWYNRSASKEPTRGMELQSSNTSDADPASQVQSSSSNSMGISPLPLLRKSSNLVTNATGGVATVSGPASTIRDEADPEDHDDSQSRLTRRSSSRIASSSQSTKPIEKSTAVSPATIQNMLDVLSFLQSGVRHLLFCGAEPSKRRSATMIACGAQAFHFREVTSQLKFSEYIEQLKVPILEAGLKASHTLIYVDCDSLTREEFDVLIHIMLHTDLPHDLYSSSDKSKILALEHQMRSLQQVHRRRPSVSSLFDDLTTVASTRPDGVISPHDAPKEDASAGTQQKKSAYRENLRRFLCVVLSFGHSTSMFDLVASHPTLYYHASVKTFRWFDRESLDAVYTDCLGGVAPINEALARATLSSDTRHDLQLLMVSIHEDAMQLLMPKADGEPSSDELGRRFGAARSRFEDFLGAFKTLFLYQKNKMNDSQAALTIALRLIEGDAHEASGQLAKSADGRSQLVEAAQAVAESSRALKEYEAMDRDARRGFLLDEQRCSLLQGEIEQEREVIQNELNKTLPDVAKATDALSQINKYHITEMKSFVNPPQLVRLAMQAVCVLLSAPPTWSEALRILADIHFVDRLRNFDKDRVDASLIDRVKMYVNHPDFSMENMKRASTASTTLCKWVLAIVRYFEVMKRVAPTQKKLSATMEQYHQIEEMVRAERQKLIDMELQLNEMRAQHVRNVQREQELQRIYESKTRWKAEVVQFQDVVTHWLRVLRKRMVKVKDQQFKLIGDCAVAAATCTYASAVPHAERFAAVTRWRALAMKQLNGRPSRTSPPTESVSMPHAHSHLKSWSLTRKFLRDEFKRAIITMDLRNDVPLTINMLLMDQMQKVRGRFPVLVDPLGRAVAWLKQRCRVMGSNATSSMVFEHTVDSDDHSGDLTADSSDALGPPHRIPRHASAFRMLRRFNILVVDASDPSATSIVEKQISHKSRLLILIEQVAECEEAMFHALVDVAAIAQKKGGHMVIFSSSSIDKMLAWKPKIWSLLGVVDCSPTTGELEDHVLTLFLKHHWPALESEYEIACDEYVTEKVKEEQVLAGFVNCLHQISADRETVRQSLSKTNTSHSERVEGLLAAVGDDDGVGLQEHEMSRISRCLEEYAAARSRRKRAKRCAFELRDKRKLFEAIAIRTQSFVFAEQQFFHRHNNQWLQSLVWDVPAIILQVDDCVRDQIPTLNCRVRDGPDADRIQGSMASMVERVTHSYIKQRLHGLPSEYHRAFRSLVAIGVATVQDGVAFSMVEALLQPVSTSVRVSEDASGQAPSQIKEQPMADEDESSNWAHTLAEKTAQSIISITLRRLAGLGDDDNEPAAPTIPIECRDLYERIQSRYLVAFPSTERVDTLRGRLREDMCASPAVWVAFARSPSLGLNHQRFDESSEEDSADNQVPRWLGYLCVLERLLLSVAVFGVSEAHVMDAMTTWYLGSVAGAVTVTKSIMEAEQELGGTGNSQQPLLVHYNPQQQVSTLYSSLTHCARLVGVREEQLVFVSMQIESDIQRLRSLKDFHASGAWVIIYDIALARQSGRNMLRLELQRLHDLLPTMANVSQEFRVWILNSIQATSTARQRPSVIGGSCSSSSPSRLHVETLVRHLYLESPRGLLEYYQAFVKEEQLRKLHLEKQQQQQQSFAQESGSSSTAKPSPQKIGLALPSPKRTSTRSAVSTRTVSSLAVPTPLQPNQMWIQAALWIFHSVFRGQVSLGVPDSTLSPRVSRSDEETSWTPLSCDLLASHFELERAMRLIQLHQRQRSAASAMAAVSGGVVGLSAMNPTAEWTTLYELASEVYAGRMAQRAMLPMCRDLMAACLVPPQLPSAVTGWARGGAWDQRLMVTRDLITQGDMLSPTSAADEASLMPHSLRWRHSHTEWRVATGDGLSDAAVKESLHVKIEFLLAGQAVAVQLMQQLPSKNCLTLGVQKQEHQRRTSVITAWRKNKPTATLSPSASQDTQPATATLAWEIGALSHLQQVEMPAMEMYLRRIWELLEYLSALKPEAMDCAPNTHHFKLLLNTLRQSQLPGAWQLVSVGSVPPRLRNGNKYAAPTRLDDWVSWVHQAVVLYQAATRSHLPDPLWLPALSDPKAFFYSILYSIATEKSLSIDSLAFLVVDTSSNRPAIDPHTQQETKGESDVVAVFRVSGCVLWNAHWSAEKHALQESVTSSEVRGPVVLDALPPLTIHVTTRFADVATRAGDLRVDPGHHRHHLYRCPLFLNTASMAKQHDPIASIFVPCVDTASVLSACGVALLLQDDLHDLP